MQVILSGILMVSLAVIILAFMTHGMNKSRSTVEQVLYASDCSETELQELLQEGLLSYRRKYLLFGPYSLKAEQISYAREVNKRLKEAKAAQSIRLRQMAEEAAARMQAANSAHQARIEELDRAYQDHVEELARTRKAHEEILRGMRRAVVPQDVLDALQVLGLSSEASFDEIVQRHRLLAKQYHPDLGGDSQQFVRINTAYARVRGWIEEQTKN